MQRHDFPRVLAAEGISNFGTMLSRLAIPFLAALQLQATPLQMAALLVADVVAGAIGSLWLGSWIDRRGKRTVMLLADGLRCALLIALALAAWARVVTVPLLVLAAATSGLLTVAFELARSAWIAQRVIDADLPRRNAQLSVAGSLSETAAFALGGWLYQGLGAALSLAVDLLSYAVSALCLRGVAEVPAAKPQPTQPTQPTPSYMICVTRDIALPTGPLGMIAALGALGAVVGASLAPRLGRAVGPGWTMTLGLVAFALGAACIPAAQGLGWATVAWLVAHQIVGDAGHVMHDVHDRTLRQTAVPAALLARVPARCARHWTTPSA